MLSSLKLAYAWVMKQEKPIEINLSISRIPILNAGAITLWPFIFYCKGYRTHCIIEHEHHHWRHILHTGIIPWYVVYIALAVVLTVVYLIMYKKLPPPELHPLEYEPSLRQKECEAEHATVNWLDALDEGVSR
jgi:uncharacterized membrane protein YadS